MPELSSTCTCSHQRGDHLEGNSACTAAGCHCPLFVGVTPGAQRRRATDRPTRRTGVKKGATRKPAKKVAKKAVKQPTSQKRQR